MLSHTPSLRHIRTHILHATTPLCPPTHTRLLYRGPPHAPPLALRFPSGRPRVPCAPHQPVAEPQRHEGACPCITRRAYDPISTFISGASTQACTAHTVPGPWQLLAQLGQRVKRPLDVHRQRKAEKRQRWPHRDAHADGHLIRACVQVREAVWGRGVRDMPLPGTRTRVDVTMPHDAAVGAKPQPPRPWHAGRGTHRVAAHTTVLPIPETDPPCTRPIHIGTSVDSARAY